MIDSHDYSPPTRHAPPPESPSLRELVAPLIRRFKAARRRTRHMTYDSLIAIRRQTAEQQAVQRVKNADYRMNEPRYSTSRKSA